MQHSSFVVQRQDLRKTDWVPDEAASAPLIQGAVRLRVDSFALTANNISYAVFGDAMKYWNFFPCAVAGYGRVPVWGFADVTESHTEGVAVGERFYGYWPIAAQVDLQPAHVSTRGFHDNAEHRRELPAVYNHYTRCSADPRYAVAHEAVIALLRPLFSTSFLIDDFLADNAFFGARTVLLSSASSKTAYGTAFCLAQRRGSAAGLRIVGLTSPANLAFTQGLGCYDEVLAYDAVDGLDTAGGAVYLDFSGSAPLRAAVHTHFGVQLAYSCSIGASHWDELRPGSAAALPGPRATLFFAPAQIAKRSADWGAAGLQQRIAEAWSAFMAPVVDAQPPWLTVVHGRGAVEIERVYRQLLDGRGDPQQGHMLSL
jgi:hypothetical protein